MNKPNFVTELAARTGMTKKDASTAYDAVLDIIRDAVASGDPVVFQGVGKFKYTRRDARVGRNPHDGTSVEVPAKTYVSFAIAWKLKQAVSDIEVTDENSGGDDGDE